MYQTDPAQICGTTANEDDHRYVREGKGSKHDEDS